MKTRFIVILIIIIFPFSSLFSQPTSPCTTPPCYGTMGCANWSPWAEKWEQTEIPTCPGCTLSVRICYRQCLDDPKIVEMWFGEIKAVWPICGPCDCLTEYLNTNDMNLLARKLRHLWIELFHVISIKWWNQFVFDLEELDVDPPWCDQEDYRYKIYAYSGSCMAACYTQYPIDEPNVKMKVTYNHCVEEYCCRRILKFCMNRDNTTHMEENLEEDIPQDCTLYNFPLVQCPPGQNVKVSNCISYCTQD